MNQQNAIVMKRPIQFFFREYLPGDLKKFNQESNTASTGGGARDLRVPKRFAPLLAPFFTQPTATDGVNEGVLHWMDAQNGVQSVVREFWRPTEARPNESRIAVIKPVEGWRVDETEYLTARANGEIWFFLLILDADQKVWAQVYKDKDWRSPQTDSQVRAFFEQQVKARRGNSAVCGFMDFQTGVTFP